MSKKKKVVEKKERKLKKWQIATLCALISGAVLVISMAVILPLYKINEDLERRVDGMTENEDALITITDMGAENIFGGEKGETSLSSRDLLEELEDIVDDMRYNGQSTDSLGAWDIRLRVNGGEIYLTSEGVYYTSGSVKYRFVPEDNEAKREYERFYNEIRSLLK